jgi:hypothetical protein
MKNQVSTIQWGRVWLASGMAAGLSFCAIAMVITAYAMVLGIQAQGAPDEAQISQFADQIGFWGGSILTLLLTIGAAAWATRKVETGAGLHGALIGLLVAVIGLILSLIFGQGLNPWEMVTFALTVGAGWLGGVLGRSKNLSEFTG